MDFSSTNYVNQTWRGIIAVPGRAGKLVSAVIEDARFADNSNELADSIQYSTDELEFNLCRNMDTPGEFEDNAAHVSAEPRCDFNGCQPNPTDLY